jgi:hypothetical protein
VRQHDRALDVLAHGPLQRGDAGSCCSSTLAIC